MELKYKTKSKSALKDAIYSDVTILSNGTWHQQDKKSNIFYPTDILQRDALNWKRKFIYIKHTERKDGTPHDAFNIVGFVEKPHYSIDKNAIVGDLRIIGSTQIGKDVIQLIDKGIIKYLSPEVWTDDHYSYTKGSRVVTKLNFNGVALVVDNPACKDTEINRFRKSYVN